MLKITATNKNTPVATVATTTPVKSDIVRAVRNGIIAGAASAGTFFAITMITDKVVNTIKTKKAEKAAADAANGSADPAPEATPEEDTTAAPEEGATEDAE